MPRITPGNRLYLYSLFSREIGVGKQTMISRVEEVLLADDIMPCDLACDSTRELLEQLDEFVRLTVFKKGRVYATILPREDWDALLAQADADAKGKDAGGAKGGPKSWKRKKSAKALRPAKPRPRNRPTEEDVADAEKETKAEVAPEVEVVGETAAEAVPEQDPKPELPEAEPTPEPEAESEAKPEPLPAPEVEPEPEPTPEPKPIPEVVLEPEPESIPESEPEPEPLPAPEPEPAVEPVPEPASLTPDPWPDLPHAIVDEVYVDSATLATLYRILPLDVDPLALVTEDWRVARSTNSFEGDRRSVVFCLRSLVAKDAPVRIELRRISPTAQGLRWEMALATSDEDLANVRFEGLPHTNEGIWRDLDVSYDNLRAYGLANPERALAQFAVLGSWNDLLGNLAQLAEKESWGSNFMYLREYLATTFVRIQRENKIVYWADDKRAAFDTGLLTPAAKRILMMFCACEGDIPWRFDSFCATELVPAGAGDQPEPATYIDSLASITLAPPYEAQVPKVLERTYGPRLRSAIDQSLLRARRNYRVATPAYDPHANELRLLLPLVLNDEGVVNYALVLAPNAEGYAVRAVVTLPRARACARVVSSELPRWLER